jgi:hypothetical protein
MSFFRPSQPAKPGEIGAEEFLELLARPGQVIQAAHVIIDVPALLLGQLDQRRVVGRQADQHALVSDALEQVGQQARVIWWEPSLTVGSRFGAGTT